MNLDVTKGKLASGEPLTIVALGDSLTQGWMVRKGYLDFLEEMLAEKFPSSRARIVNKGIPGDTAEGGLYRLTDDVISYSPDCVFIQFALNDAFSGSPVERYRLNIQTMIDRIESETDADILLVTSVALGNDAENVIAERFYGRLEELARENELPIARVHEYWRKKITEGATFRKLVQFDQVHPTVDGYRLMAEAIMEAFG
jgi:acyl-CoA thioesterase I